ncbi:PREDICTED: NSFL1 cofactor p47-like [Amphimedon queenslandica]|uniref:UBA domain-containing protein n=1 Tax=Amphimedon queenslandica TaxID=400682 RepID=A0AAN0JFK1_AMPQE|nr:PREDICTED: NSFL1 cofactor p47-like [Amphimedon queenslandica]|eukprot:XP_019855815.1 PREDICTED: NSFL1 cofactor p47-like [Amphimedon queenslandica]
MDNQIDEFCLVTGATRERAQFFLQASNGNLQAALDGFYNEDSVQDEESETTPSISPPPPAAKPGPDKHKVASLSDYTSSEGTKDDEGQSFFAGGSEHSGQLISGLPPQSSPVRHFGGVLHTNKAKLLCFASKHLPISRTGRSSA